MSVAAIVRNRTGRPVQVGRRRTMACSRNMSGRGLLLGGGLGVFVLALLVGQVALSNAIVGLRLENRDLQADRTYLESRIGLMETTWNQLCRRDRITEAAGERLGLVLPDGPGLVVVLGPSGEDEPAGRRRGGSVGGRADHLALVGLGNAAP